MQQLTLCPTCQKHTVFDYPLPEHTGNGYQLRPVCTQCHTAISVYIPGEAYHYIHQLTAENTRLRMLPALQEQHIQTLTQIIEKLEAGQ